MNKQMIAEILSAALFSILAVFLINPMGLWMPSMAHMTMLALFTATFGSFLVFALRERPGDERDDAHRSLAGRAAYLAGGAVLIVGVLVQSFGHAFDPWLVAALVAMVVGKVITRVWNQRYK